MTAFRTELAGQPARQSKRKGIFLPFKEILRWGAVASAAVFCLVIGASLMPASLKIHKVGQPLKAERVFLPEANYDGDVYDSIGVATLASKNAVAQRYLGKHGSDKSNDNRREELSGALKRQTNAPSSSRGFKDSLMAENMEKSKSRDEASKGDWSGKPGSGLRAGIGGGRGNAEKLQNNLSKGVIAPDRKIIKTGTLNFEVENFEDAYQKVVMILTEEKGYIASSSSTKLSNGKIRGQIIIRILPERFDSVTLKLRALGELKHQDVSSQDITKKYVDLMARLKNARALEARLLKLLKEKKGKMEELLKVEKEIANVRERIERFQGELKYYDNLTSLATIVLNITEKDIGQAVEYVQTQSGNLVITVADVEKAYKQAQEIVHALKGQIVKGQLNDQNQRIVGIVKGHVDAEQFVLLVEQLKGLGEVKTANIQQQTSSQGETPAKPEDTRIRKERGSVVLNLLPPAGEYIHKQKAIINLESSDVDSVYARAQKIARDTQAKIMNGNINRGVDRTVATIVCQVESDRFRILADSFKVLGKVLSATMDEEQIAQGIDPKSTLPAPVRKNPAIVHVIITSPQAIVAQDSGVWKTLRNTLRDSIKGVGLSLQYLIVGLLAVAPWIIVIMLIIMLFKRVVFKKKS